MANHPRILALAPAQPQYIYPQADVARYAQEKLLGDDWRSHPEMADYAQQIEHLFSASGVEWRQGVVDLLDFYSRPRTTAERMEEYQRHATPLARTALEAATRGARGKRAIADISDFIVVSCTGYSAPGLDLTLARDLEMARDIRRVCIGHMGCYGALVGLRECLATVRAHPDATAALLTVELSSLHYAPNLNSELLTAFALFGDGAAAALLSYDEDGTGPQLVDTYCAADFSGMDQMTWNITDQGFIMGLSPRVPVTLRRNVRGIVEHLLQAHDLDVRDVAHWIVHPGGPSILDVIQAKLELSDEQMAPSWKVLREHGNCSSATVLLILDELLRAGRPKVGEWGVMMAFGPGLTLETALLRF